MALAPGDRFGPYEIRGPLGAGGMGEVYLARDSRLGRDVALKLLPEARTADPVARRRLLDEARTIARLDHPNLCAIYEVGEHDGRVFLALQRIAGVTLEDRLARGALAEGDALAIAAQVAAGVAHAHAAGVLHRDLKPRNIMVTPEGRAIVLDFGIARAAQSGPEEATRTIAGQSSGTPSAMSPEQARGEPLDARTDVFSFGAMFYRMVSGRDPFARSSAAESIAAVLGLEPPPLQTASPELARIVDKCLAKDRALRYGSMSEVKVDLDRLARGAPAPRSRARRIFVGGLAVAAIGIALAFALRNRAPAPGGGGVRTLAVLPFRALTPGENYLGLGIADAVITRISQDADLVVRPTSSVRRYAATDVDAARAAKELKVDAVLEGSWQKEGDRLRLSANLVRAADQQSLWSETFEAKNADIFAIQERIAQTLADRLRGRLAERPPDAKEQGGTRDPRAYEAYTKGLFYFSERGYFPEDRRNSDVAIEQFAEAVRIDPGYALAHAQLAYARLWTALFIEHSPSLADSAEAGIAVAERLAPQLALVPFVRSQILFSKYRSFRLGDAIRQIRLAKRQGINLEESEVGGLYLHLGLDDEWRRLSDAAIARDPTNRRLRIVYVHAAYQQMLPELGRQLQKQLLGEDPDERYWSQVGDLERTARPVEAWAREHPDDPRAHIDLAELRSLQHRCAEADALIRRWEPRAPRDRAYHHLTYQVAQCYAECGNAKEAVRWLDETVKWGFPALPLFERDPRLAAVRKSPEYAAFMARFRPEWEQLRKELEAP